MVNNFFNSRYINVGNRFRSMMMSMSVSMTVSMMMVAMMVMVRRDTEACAMENSWITVASHTIHICNVELGV